MLTSIRNGSTDESQNLVSIHVKEEWKNPPIIETRFHNNKADMSSMYQGLDGEDDADSAQLRLLKDEILNLIERNCLPQIQEANQNETFGRYLVKSRVDSRFIDDLDEYVQQELPGCKLEMEFMAADKDIGDLYVITYMPNTAHDGVVREFIYLFRSYTQQDLSYENVLVGGFPSLDGFDPDGGMALCTQNRQVGTVYHRTILLEVEKSHRTLPELYEHMIQYMITVDTICYSIAIKIFARQQDELFSAVLLLFQKDVNNNPYCFHAYDFGTAAITTDCRNLLKELSVPIWTAEPRVTLDANLRLVPPNNPWTTPTFSIPGRFIFGNSREAIVLGGITLTIPDNPTDLDVDLFEVLKDIAIHLP